MEDREGTRRMGQWIDLAERRQGRRLADLVDAEALLIGALRVWVAAFQQRRCGLPELRFLFNRHGRTGGGMFFHHLLLQTATGAYRTLDVGRPCCAKVQMDEERLLALFAAFQRGQAAAAEIHLGSWMPPQSIAPCMKPAESLALMMKNEGFDLPPRPAFALDLENCPMAAIVPIYARHRRAANRLT